MAITIERDGQRVYLSGDTYSVKDRIKALGGHWDGDRRAWWVGAAKAAEVQQMIGGLAAAPEQSEGRAKQDPSDIRLTGKGIYKGRTYFLGSRTRDGQRIRCLTLPEADGSYVDFWADCSAVEVVKTYQPREERGYYGRRTGHMSYITIGSIASFVRAEREHREKGGDVCAECGKSGELVRDLEDGGLKHRHCCDIEP